MQHRDRRRQEWISSTLYIRGDSLINDGGSSATWFSFYFLVIRMHCTVYFSFRLYPNLLRSPLPFKSTQYSCVFLFRFLIPQLPKIPIVFVYFCQKKLVYNNAKPFNKPRFTLLSFLQFVSLCQLYQLVHQIRALKLKFYIHTP